MLKRTFLPLQGRSWLVLLLIPCTLVFFKLHGVDWNLENQTVTFLPGLASIPENPQNSFLDTAPRIGVEATKAMLLSEAKLGESKGGGSERKVSFV